VEMDIKGALTTLRENEAKLSHAMNMIAMYGKTKAGSIKDFLKAPFEERSTAAEAAEEGEATETPPEGDTASLMAATADSGPTAIVE